MTEALPTVTPPERIPKWIRGMNPDPTRWIFAGIVLLALRRLGYHLHYLLADPFARVTVSDGQLYEQAARDLLAHPPLGSAPFYLQGLYAYLLAAGMAVNGELVAGLVLQLIVAGLALVALHRASTRALDGLAGGLSTLVLLAYPGLAFYENKYLSVELGVACNGLALWVFCRGDFKRAAGWSLALGAASGLAVLGRPNMVLALPFAALALWLVAERATARRALSMFALGAALSLAPMAVRNLVVTGHADVTPSHGGGIPFYIGNNPHADGRWNSAGGLLSGQVFRERDELARRLQLRVADRSELDEAIGAEMYRRGFKYITTEPGAWLALTGKKLWMTLGNHPFVRDYDLRGERELLGGHHHLGLPFGVLLALGWLGLLGLYRTRRALFWMLTGQLVAVLAANLLVFTSAQNRLPLALPLAFAAGPGLLGLVRRLGARAGEGWTPGPAALAVAALLLAQSFWPRSEATERPSSAHYFNLASVYEVLGQDAEAAAHYGTAAGRRPKQPVFALRHAMSLRKLGRLDEARAELRRAEAIEGADPVVRNAIRQQLRRLDE